MSDHVFDLAHVAKSRPGAEGYRLNIRSLRIRPRDTLAIVGSSGCGKSTALDILACALKPDEPERAPKPKGNAHVSDLDPRFLFSPEPDREIDVFDAWERGGSNALASDRMRHLGYVLQTGGLLPFLKARDNITLVCKVLDIMPSRIGFIKSMCETLSITHLLAKYPSQLSVGERQRVAIAKALAHAPAVVLADEPTAALDPKHSRGVMELFLNLAREQGTTIVMVSHDQALAREVGFTLVPVTVENVDGGVCATLDWGRGTSGFGGSMQGDSRLGMQASGQGGIQGSFQSGPVSILGRPVGIQTGSGGPGEGPSSGSRRIGGEA